MAKQLNVNLAFTADTGKAKAQLQDLQNQLSKISMTPMQTDKSLQANIREASAAAAELKVHLEQATNVKTGTLDFTRLNDSLKKSGKSLIEYGEQLKRIGPDGQKAFMTLTQAVVNAEVPIKRSNALLNEMWTTMKNTARWQLSSSVLHGFMGALSSAYGYAQDLNESLNNIRIVTGNSVDQMVNFAKEANKAAKALSTTTTEYTNASLIYYQQGLTEAEVKERADITIKMANAAGVSAEIVSDQMTAVWNNFAEAGDNLEYYADVMTALGAATASSTDEIADGLEKFAAVAETVGLSYEYATASLATITATTRQSADVVGTALKTLFARIQGLNLGETLDDGTTLNKYSQALEKVGISIFEQNGEMKAMDNILDEMGEKWGTLNKDQQTALAQTVAGVRQYTQLMALMENWDFFKDNLNVAETASGTLEEQAEIYAESWEAAQKRVQAVLQGIYDKLIDDEAFIDVLNIIEDAISGVDNFVDAIGGLGGVLGALGVILTKVFSQQLSQSLSNAAYNMRMMTKAGQERVREEKKAFVEEAASIINTDEEATPESKARENSLKHQLRLQQELIDNSDKMSQTELEINRILMDRQKILADEAASSAKKVAKAQDKVASSSLDIRALALDNALSEHATDDVAGRRKTAEDTNKKVTAANQNTKKNLYLENVINKQLQQIRKEGTVTEESLNKIGKVIGLLKKQNATAFDDVLYDMIEVGDQAEIVEGRLRAIAEATRTAVNTIAEEDYSAAGVTRSDNEEETFVVDTYLENQREEIQLKGELVNIQREEKELTDDISDRIERAQGVQKNWADAVIASANAAMTAVTVFQTLSGVIDTLNDPDMTTWEKFVSIMGAIAMVVPMVISSVTSLTTAFTALQPAGVAAGTSITAAMGPPGLAIAAIATGVTGLIFLFIKLADAQNADAIAAKRAADVANELAEASNEAKSALSSLEQSFDAYDTAVEKLEEVRRTTGDWTEELQNVNNEILNILEKYPDLAKLPNLFNGEGLFNEEVIDNYIKKAESFANSSQMAAISGQAKSAQLSAESLKKDLGAEIELGLGIVDWQTEPGDNGTSSSIYAYGDDIVNAMLDILTNEEIEDSGAAFAAAMNSYASSLGVSEAQQGLFTDTLWTYADSIQEAANAVNGASAQIENVSSIIAAQYLGQSDVAKDKTDEWQQVYTDAKKGYDTGYIDRFTSATDANLNKLLTDAGITSAVSTDNAVFKENGVLKVQFADGTEAMSIQALAEMAANNFAIQEANKATVTDVEKENTTFSQLAEQGITLNENVSTDLANNLLNHILNNEVSPEAIEAMATAINATDTAYGQEDIISQSLTAQPELKDSVDVKGESDKYDLEAENVEHYAESLLEMSKISDEAGKTVDDISADLKDNAVMASKVAIANSRMNKGLVTLAEDFDDYRKTLDTAEKGSEEYQSAVKGISDAMNDVLGLDDVELSQDFLTDTKNLDFMAQAAKGSTEAVESLRAAAAQDIITHVELDPSVDPANKQALIDNFNALQTELDGLDLSIGAKVDTEGMYNELNKMIETTQMTTEQVQDYFNALGYTPELETTPVEQTITHTGAVPVMSDDGKSVVDVVKYTWTEEATLQVPQVKSLTYHGDAGKTVNTGAIKKAGGGSSSKPTKVDKTKKSDVVDRYKEINDAIDDLEDSIDDTNKAADRLFGTDRVKALEKERNLLKQQIPLLEKKRDEAKSYLAIDKQLLMDTGKKYGITFETDGAGNITNYTAELTKLYNELAAAEEKMNNMSTKDAQDAYKEATLDPLNEKINELKDAIAQYDETRELLEDLEDEITDAFNAWQDKNYEILTYKLEIELELNDAELQEIEFELSLIEDDFYKMAEAASFMKDKIDPLNDSLEDLKDNFDGLTKKYEDGDISQAKYIEGLQNARDGIYDQLNALVDLDKEMMEYYGNTLDAAMEELDKYTDHMEHLTGVIDHYISLMELMGKSTDFEAMDEFLSARAETTKNELDVAKSNYEMLAKQKADIEKEMSKTKEGSADWQLYKEQWDKIVATMDEAQDEMLSKTEEWMEAMKAVIENNMNKAAKSLEDALTNGMSFDHMMTELDRLNERQEEYLTKTNQVYETNKLMRAAAQAADKTDNAVAKQKFKNFAEETKQLQEKGQLSKYELEIQQAKYDLLLAEIALEDAQNAKSTVRLQRDSEGNFGYVYTADQDKISEAQQAVEDAENDLYNISLNGQQEYTEKYTQALQSMYDEMKALQEAYLAGDIATEEEYQARKDALMQHYFGVPNGILTTYSNLYNTAVQTDANATADFWATSYGNMTANTEDFKIAVNGYLVEVENETETWHEITTEAQEDINEGLEDLVDESKEYAETVEDEVIPAIEDELDAVRDLTDEYAEHRQMIQQTIKDYKELIQHINAAIAAAARQSGSSRSSSGDLSLDAANAFLAGEDASGILAERGEKMANGNHAVATDNDDLTDLFEAAKDGDQDAIDIITEVANSGGTKKFHDYDLSSFGTGGYTGEWGPQAKLAFVHEKEIMLNPDDTVNFLSAIKITRSIIEMIDKQAGWASAGLGIMSASGVNDHSQYLEQEVTIHAEFPNATDHNEIEEAFHNLMNTASQYANRKNR